LKHARIKIHGIVQGVGFRPLIHKYICSAGLTGTIKNTSSGVELQLEGEESTLRHIIEGIADNAPPLSRIERIETEFSDDLQGFQSFSILPSRTEDIRNTLISPDVAICPDCLRELRDPADRRYGYPFINCTNCGPRFTIIRDVPYDRAMTSMAGFRMCPDCEVEYKDINNRRYHAQPDCCPECGPELHLYNGDGKVQPDAEPIAEARKLLKAGGILAVMGLGGIHLACRSDLPETAARLRQRKQRDEKPFAVMCRDLTAARQLCRISGSEEKLLTSVQRPIVLLEKLVPKPDSISENSRIGIMLPYTPLHYLLMDGDIDSLIMTSANLSDTPIVYKTEEALEKLQGIADAFLLHNREIVTRCDDSLLWELDGKEYFARRSRGYVPFPVSVPVNRMILACGAEQKASFCLSREGHAFPSQHIGDLKNYETYENYERQIAHFEKLFDIEPEIVACDLHPDYMSSDYARQLACEKGIPLVPVQHHHAHMAACMADNGLTGTVIGLIWDGTGLGTDGTIWGAECLIGDYSGFERFGSIRPIPLPGGDRAAKETSRVAVSLLKASGCSAQDFENHAAYERMIDSSINAPLSSGMGRLFDGVGAILGIKTECSYEGQGAVLLEAAAEPCDTVYTISFEGDSPMCFDWRPMIREIVEDMHQGISRGEIASAFMNTLIHMAVRQCRAAADKFGLKEVVLSGGSFQNMYLMQRLPGRLAEAGLVSHHHSRVSTNDEGISLGQLMIAHTRGRNNVSCNSAETD